MPKSIATLFIDLEGSISKFAQSFGKGAKILDDFGAKAKQVGMKMSAISLPIAAVAGASLKMAGDFEASMNKVSALGSIFGKDLTNLEAQALKLGQATKFSAQDAAEGMGEYAAAGLEANQITAVMPGTLALAAAGQLSVSRAAAITGATLAQFNMDATEANKVADVLASGAAAGATSVDDLGEALKYVGTVAPMSGQSFVDLTATLSLLSNNYIKAGDAGTDLAAGFANLLAPTKRTRDALGELGLKIEDLQTADGKLIPIIDIVNKLSEAGIKGKQVFSIFGKENAKSWSTLLDKGAPALQKLQTEIDNDVGAAQRMQDILNKGLNGAMERMRGSVETLGISFGKILSPSAQALAGVFEGLANKLLTFTEWFQTLPPWVQTTASAFVGLTAVTGPLLVGLGFAMQGLSAFIVVAADGAIKIPILTGTLSILSGTVKALGGAFALLLTPFGAILAAGAALAVLGVEIYRNWDWIGPMLTKQWETTKNQLIVAWDQITIAFDDSAKAVKEAILGMKDYVVESFNSMVESVTKMVDAIKTQLQEKLTAVLDSVKAPIEAVSGFFAKLYDDVVGHSYVPDMVDGVQTHVERLEGDALVKPVEKATDAAGDAFVAMETKIESTTGSIAESVSEMAGKISDSVSEIAQALGATSELAKGLGDFASSAISGQAGGGAWGSLGAAFGSLFGGGQSLEDARAAGLEGPPMADGSFGTSGTGGFDYGGAASALAKVFGSAMAAKELDKKHGDNRGTGGALGGGAGGVIGAVFGGPGGAQIGQQIGQALGSAIGSLLKRGSQNAATQARHAFANYVEEQFAKLGKVSFFDAKGKLQQTAGNKFNFLEGDKGRFNPGGDTGGTNWGDNFKAMGDQAMSVFGGLGAAFKELLGITEDVSGQIGYLIATNMSGNLDNARLFVQQLGVSQEEMLTALETAAVRGDMSWHDYNVAVAGVTEAFKEGLTATGAYGAAFDNLRESGGKGMAAIKSFRDIAVEALEKGIKSMDELKAKMIAEGADPAEVEALFAAAAQRGIKTLEGWKDASNAVAGSIVGDMYALSTSLASKWDEMKNTLTDVYETINQIPDKVEKSVVIDVKVNDPDGGLNLQETQPKTIEEPDPLIEAKRLKISRGAQALRDLDTDAMMPVARVGRNLRNGASPVKSRDGMTVVVNAPYSDPGSADHIRNTVLSMKDYIVGEAVEAVFDNARRGG